MGENALMEDMYPSYAVPDVFSTMSLCRVFSFGGGHRGVQATPPPLPPRPTRPCEPPPCAPPPVRTAPHVHRAPCAPRPLRTAPRAPQPTTALSLHAASLPLSSRRPVARPA